MFYEIINIKPCYQGNQTLLSFSCTDPKQRYYLNGIWTCGSSVLILFQWFQSLFSSNEKLHFTQLSPKGLRIKKLIVAGSSCNNHSKQFQQSQGIPEFLDAIVDCFRAKSEPNFLILLDWIIENSLSLNI